MADAEERRIMAAAARRYYLDDATKVEIGRELGISRFKVARLLTESRRLGLVRIEIVPEADQDPVAAQELCRRLGLAEAVVVDLPPPTDDLGRRQLRHEVGRCAAELLPPMLGDDDVLGLPSSRSVTAMVSELRDLPPVPVVQLSGALTVATDEATSVDLVREVARIGGGTAHAFFAPLIAADRASARVLRRQPSVAEAFDLIPSVSVAVVGIGGWAPHESTLYDLLTEAEHETLRSQGVVGEISGAFFDAAGRPLQAVVSDRVISVTVADLQAIPTVVGLALGAARVDAVRAAISSGLVQVLICDAHLAAALLEQPEAAPPAASATRSG